MLVSLPPNLYVEGRELGPLKGEAKASSLSAGLLPISSPVYSTTRPCWTGRTGPSLRRVVPYSSTAY